MIIWFTGISGSGKTTLAGLLEAKLKSDGLEVGRVDGDLFRKKEKRENIFSKEEIIKNNERMLEHSGFLEHVCDAVIVSAISPYEETRERARATFGSKYIEIFLTAPREVLIKRDPKGLYAKALSGEIKNLIGFSEEAMYETPKCPDLVLNTSTLSVEEALEKIYNLIKSHESGK